MHVFQIRYFSGVLPHLWTRRFLGIGLGPRYIGLKLIQLGERSQSLWERQTLGFGMDQLVYLCKLVPGQVLS